MTSLTTQPLQFSGLNNQPAIKAEVHQPLVQSVKPQDVLNIQFSGFSDEENLTAKEIEYDELSMSASYPQDEVNKASTVFELIEFIKTHANDEDFDIAYKHSYPLRHAVASGSKDLAEVILEEMTPEQIANDDGLGRNALNIAVSTLNPEMVQLLVNNLEQTGIDQASDYGTALHELTENQAAGKKKEKEQILDILLSNMSVEAVSHRDSTGRTAMGDGLFTAKRDIQILNKMSREVFDYKDENGYTDLDKILLRNGSNKLARAIQKRFPNLEVHPDTQEGKLGRFAGRQGEYALAGFGIAVFALKPVIGAVLTFKDKITGNDD